MPALFPCPNKSCHYQFDAEQLPRAAMVTCPLCRTRFPYRAAGSKSSFPPPDSNDFSFRRKRTAEKAAQAEEEESVVEKEALTDKPRMNKVLLLSIITVGLIGVLAVVYFAIGSKKHPPEPKAQLKNDPVLNYEFEYYPNSIWARDDDANTGKTGSRFNQFVYKYVKTPPAWFAFHAVDKKREVFGGEIVQDIRQLLTQNFVRIPEMPQSQGKWDGQAMQIVEFSGAIESGDDAKNIAGSAYGMSYKGVEYIAVGWAAEDDWPKAKVEVEAFRDRIHHADYRDDWKPSAGKIQVFYVKGGNYQVQVMDGIWEPGINPDMDGDVPPKKKKSAKIYAANPKDEDSHATLAFRAQVKVPERPEDKAEAEAFIMEFKAQGDPYTTALDYVKQRWKDKRKDSKDVVVDFEQKENPTTGASLPSGPAKIFFLRYSESGAAASDQKFYFVVAVLPIDDKIVVMEVHCRQAEDTKLEQVMLNFAGSLQERR